MTGPSVATDVLPTDVVHKHNFVVQAEIDSLGIRIGGPQRRCVMACPTDSQGFSVGLKEKDTIVGINNEESFSDAEEILSNCLSKRNAFQLSVERKATPGKLFRDRCAEVHGTGTRLHVRVWLPPDYTSKQQWPLIVFLHDMNQDHDQDGFLYFMKKRRPISEQAIVLAPLCPQTPIRYWWFKKGGDHNGTDAPEMVDAVVESIRQICTTFSVDVQSVHLTGSGMGGYGVWELLVQHPQLFRTAVPCCGHFDGTTDLKFRGNGRNSFKSEMKKDKVDRLLWGVRQYGIRVWVLHAPDDAEFPFVDARHLVTLLKQHGCDATLTSTGFSGHGEVAVWLYVAQEEEKKSAGNLLSKFFFPPPKIKKAPKKNKKSRSRSHGVDTTQADDAGEILDAAVGAAKVSENACDTNEEAIRSFVSSLDVTTAADNASGTHALHSAPDNSPTPSSPSANPRVRNSVNCAPDTDQYDPPFAGGSANSTLPSTHGNHAAPARSADNVPVSINGFYGPPDSHCVSPSSYSGNRPSSVASRNDAPASLPGNMQSSAHGSYAAANPVNNVTPSTHGDCAPAGPVNNLPPSTHVSHAPSGPVNNVPPSAHDTYVPAGPMNNALPIAHGTYVPARPVSNVPPNMYGNYATGDPVHNTSSSTHGSYGSACPSTSVPPIRHDSYAPASPASKVPPSMHGDYAPEFSASSVWPSINSYYGPPGPGNYMFSKACYNYAPGTPSYDVNPASRVTYANYVLPNTYVSFAPAEHAYDVRRPSHINYAPAPPMNYVQPNTHDNYASADPVRNVQHLTNANCASADPQYYVPSGDSGKHEPTYPGAGVVPDPSALSAEPTRHPPPAPIPVRQNEPPPAFVHAPKAAAPKRTLR